VELSAAMCESKRDPQKSMIEWAFFTRASLWGLHFGRVWNERRENSKLDEKQERILLDLQKRRVCKITGTWRKNPMREG